MKHGGVLTYSDEKTSSEKVWGRSNVYVNPMCERGFIYISIFVFFKIFSSVCPFQVATHVR